MIQDQITTATHAWTDHDTAMLVNSLEHTAKAYIDSPKLRKQIAELVVQAVRKIKGAE